MPMKQNNIYGLSKVSQLMLPLSSADFFFKKLQVSKENPTFGA